MLATVLAATLFAPATPAAPATAEPVTVPAGQPVAGRLPPGSVLRVEVPEAIGGKTVIGQLTVARALGVGYVTAYGCADGIPRDAAGAVARSDLNLDGRVSPIWSNRLVVKADDAGDVCFYTSGPAALVVDLNAVTFDAGFTSFGNRRVDTRVTPYDGPILRVSVPEAAGGRAVVGQLTVSRASGGGFVTAYGCADGIPRDGAGAVSRSDLNFDGRVATVWSNRLVVSADTAGDVCFLTVGRAALIVDVNAASDEGVVGLDSRRIDTRHQPGPAVGGDGRVGAGGVLRVKVPEAAGGATVVGQLTVSRVVGAGFVTAFACAAGPPAAGGAVSRSDLNFDGSVSSVWSNRLVVQADAAGDVCFLTSAPAALIVDLGAVSSTGISSFPNRRIDTRVGVPPGSITVPPTSDGVPQWPPYHPLPPLSGRAALTGEVASSTVTSRPITAVKIDNYRLARPPFGLDQADVVIEANAEGVTRFMALFHTRLPGEVGPVRSARTADLDLLVGMNRPVFGYSGANPGVTEWLRVAAEAGVLVDYSALKNPCYRRTGERPGPHNLLLDPTCALGRSGSAGPARPLWHIDASWTVPPGMASTASGPFTVAMDGVTVDWVWDAASGRYLRSQSGAPHVSASGARVSATNVVVLQVLHPPSVVDARSPHPVTVGSGAGVVHRSGRRIPVTWARATPYDMFTFREVATGAPVPLDVGTTFVQLARSLP